VVGAEGIAFMSRGPYPFKESDITRAIRAAKKAGIEHFIIEVDTAHRSLRIIPRDEVSTPTGQNEWNEVLPNGEDSEIR
jgi:hypothetical protein